jgi:hypothetical protein
MAVPLGSGGVAASASGGAAVYPRIDMGVDEVLQQSLWRHRSKKRVDPAHREPGGNATIGSAPGLVGKTTLSLGMSTGLMQTR